MFDFALDNRTLLYIAIILTGMITIYMFLFTFRYKWSKASLTLLLGNIFQFLFFFMNYINGLNPGFSLAFWVGLFEMLAVTMWMISLKYTLQEKPNFTLKFIINLVNVFAVLFLSYVIPNVDYRRSISSLLYALLVIEGTYSILKKYDAKVYKSFLFTGISMIAFSVFKVFMTVYRLLIPVMVQSVFEINHSIFYFTLASLMFVLIVNISLVYLYHDRLQSHIREMTIIDPLTKIYNRRYFMDELNKIYEKSRKEHLLVMIDIDDFKKVNDTYGHQVGDEVLTGFAMFLQSKLRYNDMVARYGGEEFVMILEISDSGEPELFMKRIRDSLKSESWSEYKVSVTFSGGGVIIDNKSLTLDENIALADKGLYKAKANGKDQVVFE